MYLFKWFLAAVLLVAGSLNTIIAKYVDSMESLSLSGDLREFTHPFLQVWGMFLAQLGCMGVYHIDRQRRLCKRKAEADQPSIPDPVLDTPKFNAFIFIIPALFQMFAKCLSFYSLMLTYASSYQTLRGASIVFTALLTKLFLKRKIAWIRWFGILIITVGLILIGVTDMLMATSPDNSDSSISNETDIADAIPTDETRDNNESLETHENSEILLGDCLIVGAQILIAVQLVSEEKFIKDYDVPALNAIGWQGVFGFTTICLLLIPLYFINVGEKLGKNPRHVMEDALDGFYQLYNNGSLLALFIANIFSIGIHLFAGTSITKEIDATTRVVLDSIRILVIWTVSLAIGSQAFHALHLFGFLVFIIGVCIYNEILVVPFFKMVWFNYKTGKCCSKTCSSITAVDVPQLEVA